jgi:molybdate/tungstate transport system substrate-binding protein
MTHLLALALCGMLALGGASPSPASGDVDVLYAGSLVTPMEGPIAAALAKDGLHFAGEGRGSKALFSLIVGGLRAPDVFITADRSLADQLLAKGLAASATTFGGASMVLGWADTSPHRALFDAVAAGKESLVAALQTPGLRIARTDPALDPKGERTIRALKIMGLPETLGTIYPEEDLLVRLETGQADAGFLYSTEAIARKLHAVPLPGAASLSGEITYTLVMLKAAPHPDAARRFADFILTGEGKTILEGAGITYTTP